MFGNVTALKVIISANQKLGLLKMNPVLLRKQLQENASDLQDFCKDLKNWGEEMKRKEEALKNGDSEVRIT